MDLIDTGFNNAYINMAIDEVLLSSRVPVLRVYQWEPCAVSIGKYQDLDDIDLGYCDESNIDIVRRITGGKAVLHEKELTYSFIIDKEMMPRSIIESYKIISSAIIQGLRTLGLNLEMHSSNIKNKDNPVCFQEPSFNELTINKKKIIGSAQARIKGKLLQHGSILTGINTEKHSSCFKIKPEAEDLRKGITYIDIPERKLKDAIKQGFSSYFNTSLNERSLCNSELSEAKKLASVKYKSENLSYGVQSSLRTTSL
ncbi:MAG: lipoate--protein ligase family protein [Candidatus Scalindua sp.]|jgi:lipoate-protein ligase A|nr:lipoate--protein ligase family protein [Candidatus Scalindua sp.]MBT5304100.1 lipoate--protein ligase family protein [Candidatus Scalindua sp.]MBT6053684.1 lipoate--protein ligase family protein [Candidatus Scalindua sp.]MBT6564872.1 lipoate--protein ligase family protein [Candidatus Scalindua sp.]MBT7213004.1 lipoate--protein ligase family protein [Candidatus Scalindua sp.]